MAVGFKNRHSGFCKANPSASQFLGQARKPSSDKRAISVSTPMKFLFSLAMLVSLYSLKPSASVSSPKPDSKPAVCNFNKAIEGEPAFRRFVSSCSKKTDWKRIFGSARLVLIDGGTHSENASRQYVASNMASFARMGITHIGLEAFLQSSQNSIDNYLATGKGRSDLLSVLKSTLLCPEISEDTMKILDSARKYRVKVIALNDDDAVSFSEDSRANISARDSFATKLIAGVLTEENSRMIAFVGSKHLSSFSLPSMVLAAAEAKGMLPFSIAKVHFIGMEPEPYLALENEPFNFERAIRDAGYSGRSFMLNGSGEFFVHLPQAEKFTPYTPRCRL
jgi:hypothetical protein